MHVCAQSLSHGHGFFNTNLTPGTLWFSCSLFFSLPYFFCLFQFYDYMQLGHCFKSFFVKRYPWSKINDITIYIFSSLSSGFEESVISQKSATQTLAPSQPSHPGVCSRISAKVTFRREWTMHLKWPIHSAPGTDAVVGDYFDANMCAYLF